MAFMRTPEENEAHIKQIAADSLKLACAQIMQQTAPYLLGDLMDDQAEVDRVKAMRQKIKQFSRQIDDMTRESMDAEWKKLNTVNHALNIGILEKIPDDLYTEIETLEINNGE